MTKTKKDIEGERVTKIVGRPTWGQVFELQEELAGIAVRFPTSLIPGGDEYGHLAMIVSDAKYQDIIQDQAFTYQVPEKPTPFDNTIAGSCETMQNHRAREKGGRIWKV